MKLTVEAIYENGVLKPVQPLPLREHEKVLITFTSSPDGDNSKFTAVPCDDQKLIEWAAQHPDLEYPPLAGER
jgi:predicted DNA-binding antitoxin AbrB/MazE fold protein